MSVIAAYASRLSSAGAGVWSESCLTKHRPAPFIHVFLALAFVPSPASWKCLGAENSAPPLVVSQIESTNSQEVLEGFLKLQEQIHATRLAIEQYGQEAKEAATQNAGALAEGLQLMQEAFSAERARELEAMQKSNKVMIIVVGTFAAVGFLTMLIMTYFQWRTSSSLATISWAWRIAPGFGPGSAGPALGPGDSRLVQGGLVEQSNLRLLAGTEQLAKRIHGLGQGVRAKLKSSEGTNSPRGKGESAAPSSSESTAEPFLTANEWYMDWFGSKQLADFAAKTKGPVPTSNGDASGGGTSH